MCLLEWACGGKGRGAWGWRVPLFVYYLLLLDANNVPVCASVFMHMRMCGHTCVHMCKFHPCAFMCVCPVCAFVHLYVYLCACMCLLAWACSFVCLSVGACMRGNSFFPAFWGERLQPLCELCCLRHMAEFSLLGSQRNLWSLVIWDKVRF